MLENLFCAFTAVFFVIGFVCSVLFLFLWGTRPKKGTTLILSFISPEEENAVARVGRQLSLLQLSGGSARTLLVAVCEQNDTEHQKQLGAVFADERRLIVCDTSRLPMLWGTEK